MLLRRETLGLLLAFVGVVLFGGTLPATRLAVEFLDPWFVSACRHRGNGGPPLAARVSRPRAAARYLGGARDRGAGLRDRLSAADRARDADGPGRARRRRGRHSAARDHDGRSLHRTQRPSA